MVDYDLHKTQAPSGPLRSNKRKVDPTSRAERAKYFILFGDYVVNKLQPVYQVKLATSELQLNQTLLFELCKII